MRWRLLTTLLDCGRCPLSSWRVCEPTSGRACLSSRRCCVRKQSFDASFLFVSTEPVLGAGVRAQVRLCLEQELSDAKASHVQERKQLEYEIESLNAILAETNAASSEILALQVCARHRSRFIYKNGYLYASENRAQD